MSYLTIEELKTFNVIPEITSCEDEPRLQFLIDYCSGIIDGYTEKDFNSYPGLTILVDGDGEKTLALPKRLYKLTQVRDVINNYIYANDNSGWGSNSNGQDNTPILRMIPNTIYCRHRKFDSDVQNIEVIGDWGYEKVPEKVLLVLVALCNRNFVNLSDPELLKRITGPYQSETLGDYQYALKNTWNSTDREIVQTTGDIYLDEILDKFRDSDFSIGVI